MDPKTRHPLVSETPDSVQHRSSPSFRQEGPSAVDLGTLESGFRDMALGLGFRASQIAQSRYHLETVESKVGTICILGVLGLTIA